LPKQNYERAARKAFSYLVLHHEEFTWPRLLPNTPVSSYLTVSPITATCDARDFHFKSEIGNYTLSRVRLVFSLLHLSSPGFPGARTLSGSLPYGVRTFLFPKEATARLLQR